MNTLFCDHQSVAIHKNQRWTFIFKEFVEEDVYLLNVFIQSLNAIVKDTGISVSEQ